MFISNIYLLKASLVSPFISVKINPSNNGSFILNYLVCWLSILVFIQYVGAIEPHWMDLNPVLGVMLSTVTKWAKLVGY